EKEEMKSWIASLRGKLGRRLIAPVMAIAMVGSIVTYDVMKAMPAKAAATMASPTTTPLDNDSVGALLSLDRAMETLAARVTPAIVNVTVTSRAKVNVSGGDAEDMQQFFERQFGGRQFDDQDGQQFGPFGRSFGQQMRPRQQQRVEHGLGSGVIISPDGYIVTNNHVVDGATDVRVTMSDRRILVAKVVGTDPLTDLAVIKVEGHDMPNAPWGDSTKLHQGQTVLAFGNPFGFRFTVTRGIVSALNRPNPSSDDARKPGQFIQTDAAINQGNSGGPLVNARGEVVGINTFLISPSGSFSGMGFAIPTQIVRPTVEKLIQFGKVTHGYMGIGISDVTPENSKFFHMTNAVGAVVSQIEPDSPGAKAGLKVGDVVTQLDGREVSDAGALQVEVGQRNPGTTIHLQVMRDGKSVEIPVTLEAMGSRDKSEKETADAGHGKPRWGIGLADITPEVREQLQAPRELHGAVIQQVQPGSPADNAGLQSGDVIVEVDRKPVQTAADVQKALASVAKGQDALVLVWSNGGNTFRVLHSAEASADDSGL
ncbi:MAG: Do family serine endopeptidase, partial [Isosphaeraceae bacterium]